MSRNHCLVKNLLDSLQRLNQPTAPQRNYLVNEVLKSSYNIGIEKVDIDKDERKEIADYIKTSIKHIDNCLFESGLNFNCDQVPTLFILRSGLQFMLDDFKMFQDSDGTLLGDTLNYLVEQQSIETLDESLEHWKETGVVTEENAPILPEEVARPSGVPSSHSWWYESISEKIE